MEIKYITTDFDIESNENLTQLVQELEKYMVPQLNKWVGKIYKASFHGPGIHSAPRETIEEFCDHIENLSEASRYLFNSSKKRIADIAFESGEEPNHITHDLPAPLICRLNALKIGIAITIYPINSYPHLENEKET